MCSSGVGRDEMDVGQSQYANMYKLAEIQSLNSKDTKVQNPGFQRKAKKDTNVQGDK